MAWFTNRYRGIAKENRRLALTDNLTALPNRRHIFRSLEDYHRKGERDNFTYSLILFDLDHFKGINDRFGHHIGDKVIKMTKDICKKVLRKKDIIGRIGGEEFLIVLPKTAIGEAAEIAERLRKQFEQQDFSFLVDGLSVTASFGVTQLTPGDENIDFVVNRADRLLYKAKNQGRNQVATSFSKT